MMEREAHAVTAWLLPSLDMMEAMVAVEQSVIQESGGGEGWRWTTTAQLTEAFHRWSEM